VAQHFGDDRPLELIASRGEMKVSFKGAPVAQAIMLPCVRWSMADPPSDRPLEAAFHRRKRPVWLSWRVASLL
jgi:hypothetical protein